MSLISHAYTHLHVTYFGVFLPSIIKIVHKGGAVVISLIFLICFNAVISPPSNQQSTSRSSSVRNAALTGVYRIDIPASDKLYSVVAGASSSVPFSEQQRFFIDLAVRLTPPDLLALEQQGTRISVGSSRAPRMTFVADGATRSVRATDGHTVRVRFSAEPDRLVFTSAGRTEDNFTVVFESIDNGKRLRVVRRIAAEALDQPLVIQTIYNKISDVAQWELYGATQMASANADLPEPATTVAPPATDTSAAVLRNALTEWIAATNHRDIDKQMSYYVPRLKAYYLTRNTPQGFVRDEKARVFAKASVIDIRAQEPEIIFQDGGRTAIMRYRKKYRIENGRRSQRGEVIQELRWQRVGQEWRIFSERDIKVLG
ncbi:MAG TPA: hypothetical protein VFP47_15480 [Pyrinomonadaceae bacterium]|nr:hypothetical protein [Pyrinomonadaceae bacterium]